MSTEDASTRINIPTFDGERENFQIWWMRFQAYALVKGFGQAVSGTADGDLPARADDVLDLTTTNGKKAQKALTRNNVAIASLTMAFTTSSLMNKIYKGRTEEYPGGLAHVIINNLIEEYQPRDQMSKVEAQKKLMAIKLESGENPNRIFEEISKIENEYNDST